MQAATRAFTQGPSLSLDQGSSSEARALIGRRRLAGAFLIELSRIRPDPSQPRRTLEKSAAQELANSVRRLGIMQPIVVRYLDTHDIYQIVSGERRYHAAHAVGFTEVPCWVQTPEAEQILLRQLAENWHRSELQPFELADALARLREMFSYSQRQLADATGKSEGEISKLLKLLELSPDVQKDARSDETGTLSRRHLYAVSRLAPKEQAEVAAVVKAESLTAIDTEQLVAKHLARRTPRRGAPVTRVQFAVPHATIVLTFRRQSASTEDIVAALEAAKVRALDAAKPLTIVRAN